MGATQKSLPMDPSIYGPAILQSKSGLAGAGNVASTCLKSIRLFYMDVFLCCYQQNNDSHYFLLFEDHVGPQWCFLIDGVHTNGVFQLIGPTLVLME